MQVRIDAVRENSVDCMRCLMVGALAIVGSLNDCFAFFANLFGSAANQSVPKTFVGDGGHRALYLKF